MLLRNKNSAPLFIFIPQIMAISFQGTAEVVLYEHYSVGCTGDQQRKSAANVHWSYTLEQFFGLQIKIQ